MYGSQTFAAAFDHTQTSTGAADPRRATIAAVKLAHGVAMARGLLAACNNPTTVRECDRLLALDLAPAARAAVEALRSDRMARRVSR